jgi:hypothetical protein
MHFTFNNHFINVNSKTPFTKQQLLPQEEKLEVSRRKKRTFIGIPKKPVIKNDVSVLLQTPLTLSLMDIE